MTQLKPIEYKCEICGNVYEKSWSDEEALAETEKNFGELDEEDMAVICDDCYNKNIKPQLQ